MSRISYKALATKPTALLTALQCTRKLCCTQLMQIMHIVQPTNEMLHNQQQGVSILTAGTPAQCREEGTCSKCYIGWPRSATAQQHNTHNSLLSAKCALCSSPHTLQSGQHTIHCWLSRARRYRAVLTKNLESFPLLLLTLLRSFTTTLTPSCIKSAIFLSLFFSEYRRIYKGNHFVECMKKIEIYV